MGSDHEFAEVVRDALATRTPLRIEGSGSKQFLGRAVHARKLDVSGNTGVVNYQPTELVVTVRGGTPLIELEHLLEQENQMLPFEPPHFGPGATIAGTICSGLSGPRRAYAGAARDALLGVRIIDGKGQLLHFGGEVMKNVAGYDISRLMCGAFGTLGIVLELSLKVVPRPLNTQTRVLELDQSQALQRMSAIGSTPAPVSGSCHHNNRLYLRLSGSEHGVASASAKIGGELLRDDERFWGAVREQSHEFFDVHRSSSTLWRLSVPPAAAALVDHDCLCEWGGAQRWIRGDIDAKPIQDIASALGGHATCFRPGPQAGEGWSQGQFSPFAPLSPGLLKLHRRLKHAFDPERVFNPGRMYAEI